VEGKTSVVEYPEAIGFDRSRFDERARMIPDEWRDKR
jgi:hypothetical protein